MRIQEVVAAAVRLFGLYLVYVCLSLVGNLITFRIVPPRSVVGEMDRYFI